MVASLCVLSLTTDPAVTATVATALTETSECFTVEEASNGADARSRIEAGGTDCLLVDETVVEDDPDALASVTDVDASVPVVLLVPDAAATPPTTALDGGATDFVRLTDVEADGRILATRVRNAVAGARSAVRKPAGEPTDGDQRTPETASAASGPGVGRQELDAVLEELGEAVFVADEDGEYVYVNSAAARITGYSTDELLAGGPGLVFPDEAERQKFPDAIVDLLATDERDFATVEATIQSKDGEFVPIEATLTLRIDDQGRHEGVVGVVRDVSERKSIEQRFRQYEAILRSFPDEIAILDTDGVMQTVIPPTDADRTTTGYDPAGIEGQHVGMMMPDDALEEAVDLIVEMVETDREHGTVEFQLIHRDDERLWREAHIALLDDEDGTTVGSVVTLRDMEERKARERELERFETLLELMPDAVVLTDLEGTVLEIHGYEGWAGHANEALVDEHMGFALTEESVARAEQIVADLVLDDDRQNATFELEVETADERTLPYENHITLLPPNDDGEIPGTMSVLRDVSERKARERELERYKLLVEASGDAVYALDTEGRFTLSNEAHQEIVDRPESEILGAHASTALPDGAVEDGRELIVELLQSERDHGTFEMDVLRPSGRRIPTENHVGLLRDEDGTFRGTVGVLRDISERLERERELQRQNERLDQFASITSHDLRNPLNLAMGYVDLLAAECESEHTATVADALDRMERLIDDTLTWARQGTEIEQREQIVLGALIPECWEAVGSEDGAVHVVDDVTVEGDPDRVRRLIENLLRNAVEHGGPDVTVEIGAIAAVDGEGSGFYVEDDGPGIPQEKREDVFEAGFTTATDGTGFGLAIIGEICEAHDWEVGVTDSDRGGARFEITGVDAAGE